MKTVEHVMGGGVDLAHHATHAYQARAFVFLCRGRAGALPQDFRCSRGIRAWRSQLSSSVAARRLSYCRARAMASAACASSQRRGP